MLVLYFPFLWLYQEVLIAQEVVKWVILVILGILQSVTSLAHLFAQKTTAVLLAFSAGIEVSVSTVLSLRGKKKCKKRRSKHFRGRSWSDLPICFFILHWLWKWVSVLISRFCGDSWICSFKQHPQVDRLKPSVWKQSFVLSAVFIAGRRRGFGRKVKSHIKNRGFMALKDYDVLSFGFPVTCLSKKKRKTTKHDKVKAKSNHDGSYVHFHVPSCPRLCGGAKSQQDTDLLSNLQALLSNSRVDSAQPQSDDQVLLQSLKSLVTQAQNKKAGFDLWSALSKVVEVEAKRRSKQQKWESQKAHRQVTNSGDKPNRWQNGASPGEHSHHKNGTRWSGWETVRWKPRVADWQRSLTDTIQIVDSPDAFARSLDNKGDSETAFVCVAQDQDQLEELISLAKGERNIMATVLAPLNIGPPDDGERIIWKVPGSFRQGLQVRSCCAYTFGIGSPELATRKVVQLPNLQKTRTQRNAANPAGPSWVLRFYAPGRFQQVTWNEWHKMVGAPGAAARAWAIDVADSSKVHLGDSFKFEMQNQRDLRGLIRVHHLDAAVALLRASGAKHSTTGQRWFVDLIGGEVPVVPSNVH